MKVRGLLAFGIILALVAAGTASARRPATSTERGIIIAGVLKWEQQDQLRPESQQQSNLSPAYWAAIKRCNVPVARVSTVDVHWAVFWFSPRYRESDPRSAKCAQSGGFVEGVWVLKRTAARSWAVTGWIYGERSGYCRELAATGIPLKAYNDVNPNEFGKACRP